MIAHDYYVSMIDKAGGKYYQLISFQYRALLNESQKKRTNSLFLGRKLNKLSKKIDKLRLKRWKIIRKQLVTFNSEK